MTALVSVARSYLDVPFRHRGRSRRGLDCIGLVVVALADVGRSVPDKKAYGRSPEADRLREALVAEFGAAIHKSELQVGDIVTMQWTGRPQHVGIVTDYRYGGLGLIHAEIANGRVIEHRLADPWPRRVIEGFRPVEVRH